MIWNTTIVNLCSSKLLYINHQILMNLSLNLNLKNEQFGDLYYVNACDQCGP
jgi:hypothetical protein